MQYIASGILSSTSSEQACETQAIPLLLSSALPLPGSSASISSKHFVKHFVKRVVKRVVKYRRLLQFRVWAPRLADSSDGVRELLPRWPPVPQASMPPSQGRY